ncbi:MAG: GNAT family N-acetyltransferase [Lachnospiraceae bacterium]|nr:GNAT family N-acetyltransferase [Lachnospiraceae bacterium]
MNETQYPKLRKATASDLNAVISLYRAAIGREGCTWNEFYPTREDAENDLSHGCLYVGTLGDEVMASVSVVPENELDGYVFFDGKNAREIARITVAKQYAGRGYAALLLRQLFERMKKDGVSSVRLLAAKGNAAALKTYENLGFSVRGEVSAYGNEYYAEELIL